MVLAYSDRIPRVPPYSGTHSAVPRASPTGLSPPLAGLPRPFGCPPAFFSLTVRPTTPHTSPHAVWAPPRSLAATGGISLDFLSCWYLDGSLPSVSPLHVISLARRYPASGRVGYPIRVPGVRRMLAPTPGLSRLAAPFLAPQLLGIHAWTLFSLDHIVLPVPSLISVKKTLFSVWRHGDSNPRPSACKADALAS